MGNTTLGTITFECADTAGESPLGLSVEVFADATVGSPADISETVTEGSIGCETAPATTVAPATATAQPRPPATGTGGSSDGSDLTWLIASLAAVGVLTLAGYTVARARSH
jgi:hypothetical protein